MEQQKQNTPKRWSANWATNETLKLVYRKMKQNVWLTFRKERAGKVKQADLYYSFSSGHIIANLDLHRHVNPERHFCIWGWLPHISLSSYCLAVLGTDPTKVPNISPRAGFWIQTSDSENAVQLSPNSCLISPLLPCLPRLFKWPKKPFLLRVSVTKVIVSPGGCLLPKHFLTDAVICHLSYLRFVWLAQSICAAPHWSPTCKQMIGVIVNHNQKCFPQACLSHETLAVW